MEVRPCIAGHKSGLGLFATQPYKVGDVIIAAENPLIRLAPISNEQEAQIMDKLPTQKTDTVLDLETLSQDKNEPNAGSSSSSPIRRRRRRRCRLWEQIQVPASVPAELTGKFKGMVQAGLCFLHHQEVSCTESKHSGVEFLFHQASGQRRKQEKPMSDFFELYYPKEDESTSQDELTIVNLAKLASQYIAEDTGKKRDVALLQKVMLIWSCNSFEGGRVYGQISRINHSCNPNAVVQANGDAQSVRALAPIAPGDEICISYLGLFLYSERPVRQAMLQQTKNFTCACIRCQTEDGEPQQDMAALVPCPACHPRLAGNRQLDEDDQYDDEQTVSYECGWSSNTFSACERCRGKKSHGGEVSKNGSHDDRWLSTMQQVRDKVVSYLQSRYTDKKCNKNNDEEDDDEEDEKEMEEDLLDQHLRLSSSVMGARHWTTNLLLLLKLDELLQRIHRETLLNDKAPEISTLGEAIDMLQRLMRFMDGFESCLRMNHCQGHVLSTVMIGTARALVSMGDEKSKAYAAEFVEPIWEYVQLFESVGMQKVVSTIADARKNNSKRNGSINSGDKASSQTNDDEVVKKRAAKKEEIDVEGDDTSMEECKENPSAKKQRSQPPGFSASTSGSSLYRYDQPQQQ